MDTTTFADRLRLSRKNKGLSQKELAARIGTGQSTIATLETGGSVSTSYVFEIAKILNVSPEWLYYGSPQQDTTQQGVQYTPQIEWEEVPNWKTARSVTDKLKSTGLPYTATTYVLEIKNDLMKPDFPVGSLIVIDGLKQPQTGDFALFYDIKNDNTLFRQYIIDGKDIYLKPLNNNYPTNKYISSDLLICGTVIRSIRNFGD